MTRKSLNLKPHEKSQELVDDNGITARGLIVRITALKSLIADQEAYLARLKLREEQMLHSLYVLRRQRGS